MTTTNCRILVTGGSGFIGTHFVSRYSSEDDEILNLDIKKPLVEDQKKYWRDVDITDCSALKKEFDNFEPTHVINFAAKATLDGKTLDDFSENVVGTKNVIKCLRGTKSVKRFVHVSTQYVVTPGVFPDDDEMMLPYTLYGESKALAEQCLRESELECEWVIARPTNIWGPRHPTFPYTLWRYIQKGWYIHPGYQPVNRYYGYVRNAVEQLGCLLLGLQERDCNRKVFYVSDPPIDSYRWMNAFSIALRGRPVRRVPRHVWGGLALAGDLLNGLGFRFPIHRQRYFRLTTEERVPLERTLQLCGMPKISLEEGVRETVAWLRRRESDG
ncbi:MAG: NAD(P)-dependent oxidoreductase [Candidatus Zixiibacteriota bacterium]|nr:MAG: NAD(P)-dependent oxidoreductase [candidate division Zixibacteria bacterium]